MTTSTSTTELRRPAADTTERGWAVATTTEAERSLRPPVPRRPAPTGWSVRGGRRD